MSKSELEQELEQPLKSPQELRAAARQVALQTLYALDTDGVEFEEALTDALGREPFTPELADYIQRVVSDFHSHKAEIDALIIPLLAKGWDYQRISKVDRALLRLGTAELRAIEEISPKVTISEAVNLAKDFGDKQSPAFVNAILGKVLASTSKAQWNRTQEKSLLDEAIARDFAIAEENELELIREGSPEHDELMKAKGWILKTGE
jgi:N utilization substance protein B